MKEAGVHFGSFPRVKNECPRLAKNSQRQNSVRSERWTFTPADQPW